MPLSSKRHLCGSSLIEVLVALVILAIGILGVFALETSSLKSNQNAYQRTQATLLTYDVIERVRANREGAANNAYDNPTAALTTGCLNTSGCTAVELAAHDIAEWRASLAQQLPLGFGVVCIDSTPADGSVSAPACDGTGPLYAVKVWWDADRDGVADQRLALSFQP